MSKPPKKTPAKAEAPTTAAPAAVAAPAPVWENLEIAVQMEPVAGGVVDPFTKEIVAKDANGLLDVRRPGGSQYPKPEGVKTNGDVATAFANWFFDKCCIGAVDEATARERFGMADFTLPEIEVDVKQVPFAFVTGKFGKHEWGVSLIAGKIARIGKRTERGYVWCYPPAMLKARKNVCARSTRATGPEDVFKNMMRSFSGKFSTDAAAPAEPKAKTAPKAAPKAAPKKVPAKK